MCLGATTALQQIAWVEDMRGALDRLFGPAFERLGLGDLFQSRLHEAAGLRVRRLGIGGCLGWGIVIWSLGARHIWTIGWSV